MSVSSNGVVTTVTTSATIANRNCIITSVSLNPAAAACTVSLYDPPVGGVMTTTGATLRITLSAPASVASACSPLDSGIEFANGCVAVVTGIAATANIGWQLI
jgi:hypothetical protein